MIEEHCSLKCFHVIPVRETIIGTKSQKARINRGGVLEHGAENIWTYVRFEVFTMVTMKNGIF
jgi:hypothetical protein